MICKKMQQKFKKKQENRAIAGEPRDAAVNFDTYRILQRHRTRGFPATAWLFLLVFVCRLQCIICQKVISTTSRRCWGSFTGCLWGNESTSKSRCSSTSRSTTSPRRTYPLSIFIIMIRPRPIHVNVRKHLQSSSYNNMQLKVSLVFEQKIPIYL